MANHEAAEAVIPNHDIKKRGTPLSVKSPIHSPQLRAVHLHDWWLMKVQSDSTGCRLGVGGFSSRGRLGIRVFCSSEIAKRHDVVTLETVDDITITICGFINRSRTLQNGFPSEVCGRFLCGFPHNWEGYTVQSSVEESMKGLNRLNISQDDCGRGNFHVSFDDLPVTNVRDLLMTTTGPDYCALTGIIFRDVLTKSGGESSSGHCERSVSFSEENASQVFTRYSLRGKPLRNHKRNDVELTTKDGSVSTRKKAKNSCKIPHQSMVGAEALSSTKGVATRSMTRSRNSESNEAENSPLSSFTKCSLTRYISEKKGSAKKSGGISSYRNTANVNYAPISTEGMDATDKSVVKTYDPLATSVVRAEPSGPITTRRSEPITTRRSELITTRKDVSNVCHENIARVEKRKCEKFQRGPAIRRSVRLLTKKD